MRDPSHVISMDPQVVCAAVRDVLQSADARLAKAGDKEVLDLAKTLQSAYT